MLGCIKDREKGEEGKRESQWAFPTLPSTTLYIIIIYYNATPTSSPYILKLYLDISYLR